jgi:hypothetical protein
MDMKKAFRAVLTSNVHPILFVFSCLVLVLVIFTARAFTEGIHEAWDNALETVGPPTSVR